MNGLNKMKKMVDEIMEEFYNLHELPEVPEISEIQEQIADMIASEDIPDAEFTSYINTATILVIKRIMNKISQEDNSSFNRAFSADSSNAINKKQVNKMNKIIDEAEDAILDEDDKVDAEFEDEEGDEEE